MLRIRLSRKGKKKQPHYRVVVADVRYKRDGRFVENIGYYNPLTDPPTVVIKEARALHWLSVGAQPSEPVRHFLLKQGTYERLKRLHAGEELETLAAEFDGPAVEEEAPAKKGKGKAAKAAAEVVEKVEETAAEAAEVVEEVVEKAAETAAEAVEVVEEVVETAVETAAETVEEVVDAVKEVVSDDKPTTDAA